MLRWNMVDINSFRVGIGFTEVEANCKGYCLTACFPALCALFILHVREKICKSRRSFLFWSSSNKKMWKIILKDVCIIVFFLLYLRTLHMFVYITQNINGNVCIKKKMEQSAFYFARWNMFYRSIHILRNENEYCQDVV